MNRILIVDDEKSIQLLFADELTEEGYEVITTGDGSGLMGLIEKKRPDLVVLDIKLGKNDGLDLLQDIRNTYYDLPVIMCTAYPDYKYDLKSIAADYYVLKSSDLRELKRKIKMAFESGEQFKSMTMFKHLHQEAEPLQNTL
jgi:DNA-binding response OmpR family regulator